MGKLELALNCAIREQGRFHPDGKDGTCKAEILLTKYHVTLHIAQLPHEYNKNTMAQTDMLVQRGAKSTFGKM